MDVGGEILERELEMVLSCEQASSGVEVADVTVSRDP